MQEGSLLSDPGVPSLSPGLSSHPADRLGLAGWIALGAGLPAMGAALVLDPHAVAAAAAQDWAPFVLVTGLLALGLVARDDGLFDAAGSLLSRGARGAGSLFVGAAILVALVTAVLNLDTAVAFLTPLVVVAARRRRTDDVPFLYLVVFLANGASLVLPGSNLTNLIVLGDVHQSGSAFASTMVLPWLASAGAVTVGVGMLWRRSLHAAGSRVTDRVEWRAGAGLLGVATVVTAMLVLTSTWAAAVAAAVGAAAAAWSLAKRRTTISELRRTVSVPVLAGLFVLAVDLGTLGRVWDGPTRVLAHASFVVTAVVGALASVVVNNLPAASLLAARPLAHPHALLVGLDLGPNLAITGALSAVLWLQVSRTIGARPSLRRYTTAGAVIVPVSMALALSALAAAH